MSRVIVADVLIYVAFFLVFAFAVCTSEYWDLVCPNGPSQVDKSVCGEGNGKWYQGCQYNPNASIEDTLNAIKKGATSITAHVYWRRCFILAFFVVGSIYLVVLRRFPNGQEFIISFILAFAFLYFGQNFYNFHYYKVPEKNILANVGHLEKLLAEKSSEK
jgi:hypothetical protein